MKSVEFLLDAQEMLDEITDYTLRNWTSEKNDDILPEYVSELINACNGIPARTRYYADQARETKYGIVYYFKFRYHYVFYRETDTCYQVIQILHERMDFVSHLE